MICRRQPFPPPANRSPHPEDPAPGGPGLHGLAACLTCGNPSGRRSRCSCDRRSGAWDGVGHGVRVVHPVNVADHPDVGVRSDILSRGDRGSCRDKLGEPPAWKRRRSRGSRGAEHLAEVRDLSRRAPIVQDEGHARRVALIVKRLHRAAIARAGPDRAIRVARWNEAGERQRGVAQVSCVGIGCGLADGRVDGTGEEPVRLLGVAQDREADLPEVCSGTLSSWPLPWRFESAGSSMSARIALMAMTTSSSISVKPSGRRSRTAGGDEAAFHRRGDCIAAASGLAPAFESC